MTVDPYRGCIVVALPSPKPVSLADDKNNFCPVQLLVLKIAGNEPARIDLGILPSGSAMLYSAAERSLSS
jgi:hypothetical protein